MFQNKKNDSILPFIYLKYRNLIVHLKFGTSNFNCEDLSKNLYRNYEINLIFKISI